MEIDKALLLYFGGRMLLLFLLCQLLFLLHSICVAPNGISPCYLCELPTLSLLHIEDSPLHIDKNRIVPHSLLFSLSI